MTNKNNPTKKDEGLDLFNEGVPVPIICANEGCKMCRLFTVGYLNRVTLLFQCESCGVPQTLAIGSVPLNKNKKKKKTLNYV